MKLPRPSGLAAALMSLTLLVGSAQAAKKPSRKRDGDVSVSTKSVRRKAPEVKQKAKLASVKHLKETKQKKVVERRTPPPSSPSPASPASSTSAPPAVSSRGPTRIDFDDRLIQGQTNKSGAVYLYDRKELKIRSMIKQRDSFRDDIIATVYDG